MRPIRKASALARSDAARLAKDLGSGDRRALARAITLIESTRAEDRPVADALLERVLPDAGGAVRLGITGAPGVGKSTFIEALGLHLIAQGRRVAVLAVDPTSRRSRGSILGDKTRMQDLARAEAAFIRPSPAGDTLGGVARRTRESMSLCAAAGFDVVLVETVGAGQSESAVADLVDLFLLLVQPGAGDELQGLKRGIVELAELIVVNKADGDLAAAATRAAAEYRGALGLLRPATGNWRPPVLECSALTARGIAEVWETCGRFHEVATASGELAAKRARQARAWMWSEVTETLLASLRGHPGVARQLARLEQQVLAGKLSPAAAARRLLEAFLGAEGREQKTDDRRQTTEDGK